MENCDLSWNSFNREDKAYFSNIEAYIILNDIIKESSNNRSFYYVVPSYINITKALENDHRLQIAKQITMDLLGYRITYYNHHDVNAKRKIKYLAKPEEILADLLGIKDTDLFEFPDSLEHPLEEFLIPIKETFKTRHDNFADILAKLPITIYYLIIK